MIASMYLKTRNLGELINLFEDYLDLGETRFLNFLFLLGVNQARRMGDPDPPTTTEITSGITSQITSDITSVSWGD